MSIESNYDKTISTKRLVSAESGEDGQEKYDDYLANVPCQIQPLDEGYTEDAPGQFGKDFLMFCPVLDILEGDIIISGAIQYRAVGLEKYNFQGQDKHMEIRIRLFND